MDDETPDDETPGGETPGGETPGEATRAEPSYHEPSYEEPSYEEPTVAAQLFDAGPADGDQVETGEEPDLEPDDEAEDDDEKRGVSLGTKLLVVAAAWILLTLFLIGQFKDDDDPLDGSLTLDQGASTTLLDELGEPVEGEAEEPVDEDGDGEIEPGEPGFATASTVGGAALSGSSGGGSGTSGGSSGSGGSTGGGTDVGPAPLPGGSASSTTTTTTTTVKGQPGTTTTSTSTPKGGGSTSTTSTTAPTPRVEIDSGCGLSETTVQVGPGQTVEFVNKSSSTKTLTRVSGGEFAPLEVPKDETRSRTFSATTVVKCGQSGDTLTINVE